MATVIDMPKLSDTMTVGTLVKWLKNEGDPVENGDMIAEVETDKATMEVECFDDGILLKQYCQTGDEVPVGGAIAAVGEADETAPEPTASASSEPAAAAPVAEPSPTPTSDPIPEAEVATIKVATDTVKPSASSTDSRIRVSPLAKKIAAERGIDLSTLQGSGPWWTHC
jgi:pyruvate dehydrogenase E2 component (dihydrolipoamide acetyltransferase)